MYLMIQKMYNDMKERLIPGELRSLWFQFQVESFICHEKGQFFHIGLSLKYSGKTTNDRNNSKTNYCHQRTGVNNSLPNE